MVFAGFFIRFYGFSAVFTLEFAPPALFYRRMGIHTKMFDFFQILIWQLKSGIRHITGGFSPESNRAKQLKT